jgi:uncharacterized membrane protein YccF (DUF307 family)
VRDLRIVLNVLWIIFGGGLVIACQYALGGLLLCCTVVGIPFGVQCFKIAQLGLLPFGKDIQDDPASVASGGLGLAMNVLWIVVGGLWIFCSHVVVGLALACTIIGIPFAMQHLKLARLSLVPFGKRIVDLPS